MTTGALLVAVGLYLAWGIVHHTLRGDLHWKVVLEYLAVAILGVAIVYSVSGRL